MRAQLCQLSYVGQRSGVLQVLREEKRMFLKCDVRQFFCRSGTNKLG